MKTVSRNYKSDPGLPKKLFNILNESPLKVMKIDFYFILKALKIFSFLRYFNFCPDVFGHIGKQVDKNAKVNFKIYDIISK